MKDRAMKAIAAIKAKSQDLWSRLWQGDRRLILGVFLALTLLTGVVTAGAYIQEISMIVVEQRGRVTLASGQEVEQWMVSIAKSYANPGLAAMKTKKDRNGVTLWDAIHELASGDLADTMVAVAIHEGGGVIGATESGGGGGRCAFQITGDATFRTAASRMGVSVGELKAHIMSDARMCAAAGLAVLESHAHTAAAKGYPGGGSLSGPGALCLYAGQIKTDKGEIIRYYKGEGAGQTFFTWNKCPSYVEVYAIISAINGHIITGKAEGDLTKSTYSYLYMKDSNGNEIGIELTCVDYSETLAIALAKSSKSFRGSAMTTYKQQFSDSIVNDNQNNNENQRGSNKDKKCLKKITSDYFKNIIQKLHDLDSTSLASLLKSFLDKLIDDLTGLVCNWAATTINNLLTYVCLPLSDINFGFSLSAPGSSSCNGVSLADLFKISSDYGNTGVTVSSSSLLSVHPLGLTGWMPPEMNMPMSRGMMTTTTGTGDQTKTTSTPIY